LKYTTNPRPYKYLSPAINVLEIIGYTAIIYYVGGVEAAHLALLYAALITYVGVVAPRTLPFILAAICAASFTLMVVLVHLGILPDQTRFPNLHVPWLHQVSIVVLTTGLLFVVAFTASYTAQLLKRAREKLQDQNTALAQTNERLRDEMIHSNRIQGKLAESEALFRTITENMHEMIAIADPHGVYRYLSPSNGAIAGYPPEEMIGKSLFDFLHPEDVMKAQAVLAQDLPELKSRAVELRFRIADGSFLWIETMGSPIYRDDGTCQEIVLSSRDISESKLAEEALRESEQKYMELSVTDGLTGLYNLRHFYSCLHTELERTKRYHSPLCMLLLDLDDFKQFNDMFGHMEGDKVLKGITGVIKQFLRKTDFAFRYGGEEFVILLPETVCDQAVIVAERIRVELKTRMFTPRYDGIPVSQTVSIGVAQFIAGEESKSFIARADRSMYRAKENGKDQVAMDVSGDRHGA
jgi:diguanylate cyclase (GGDEF)-like protein/PAS domain S-box-containing protein